MLTQRNGSLQLVLMSRYFMNLRQACTGSSDEDTQETMGVQDPIVFKTRVLPGPESRPDIWTISTGRYEGDHCSSTSARSADDLISSAAVADSEIAEVSRVCLSLIH